MLLLLAHAVHQATTLRAWMETLCTRRFSVLQYLLHLGTARQFGMKIMIKSPDARYTNYWITWLQRDQT